MKNRWLFWVVGGVASVAFFSVVVFNDSVSEEVLGFSLGEKIKRIYHDADPFFPSDEESLSLSLVEEGEKKTLIEAKKEQKTLQKILNGEAVDPLSPDCFPSL